MEIGQLLLRLRKLSQRLFLLLSLALNNDSVSESFLVMALVGIISFVVPDGSAMLVEHSQIFTIAVHVLAVRFSFTVAAETSQPHKASRYGSEAPIFHLRGAEVKSKHEKHCT